MNDDDRRGQQNLIGFVVAIVLVAFAVWVLIEFKHSSDTLDCLAAHHRNCEPIEMPQQQ